MSWFEAIALMAAALFFFWLTGVRLRLKQLLQHTHQSAQALQQQLQHRHAMLEPFVRPPKQATAQGQHFRRAVACHAQVLAACTLMVEQPKQMQGWQTFGQTELLFQEAMQTFLADLPSEAKIRPRSGHTEKVWQPFHAAWAEADGQVKFVKQSLNDHIRAYSLAMSTMPTTWVGTLCGHKKIPQL